MVIANSPLLAPRRVLACAAQTRGRAQMFLDGAENSFIGNHLCNFRDSMKRLNPLAGSAASRSSEKKNRRDTRGGLPASGNQ
jgi:hypothetical protein